MKDSAVKIALGVVFIIFFILLLLNEFVMPAGYGMMFPSFGAMWILGWFFMILLFVVLVLVIIWLIKEIQRGDK